MGNCLNKKKKITPDYQLNHISSIHKSIHADYKTKRFLGTGGFGVVRLAIKRQGNNQLVAIKTLQKAKFKQVSDIIMLKNQLDILMQIDHPNIINLYQSYQDEKYIHIVMEYCSGGDMLSQILDHQLYSQKQAAKLMKKILRAINNLHHSGICHRDIKPDNFMFVDNSRDSQIKLIDFGVSTKFRNEQMRMNSVVGTPYYIAPQVLNRKYTTKCDM